MKLFEMKVVSDIVAVSGSILGSTIIAMNLGYNALGYFFFILASIATLHLLCISTASKSLYVVNAYFLVINVVGLFRY